MTIMKPRSGPGVPAEQGSRRPSSEVGGPRRVLMSRRSGLWLASLVVALYIILGLVVPLVVTLTTSLEAVPFWRAYSEQLSSSSLQNIMGRTLLLALATTAITTAIGYPVAYAMTLMGGRARAMIFALLVFPQLTSYLVRSYAWIGLLGPHGPVIDILHRLGISTPTLNYTVVGVIVVLVHGFLPLVILTCYVSMTRIDPSHLRAARTLGANHLESFWRVYAPQTKSGAISAAALVFILAAGMYVTPALIGGPAQTTVVTLVLQQVTQSAFGVAPAYPAALAIMLAAVVALVIALAARFVGLGEVLGLKTTREPRAHKSFQRSQGPRQRRALWAAVRRIPAGSGRFHVLVRATVVLAVLLVDGPFVYLVGMSFQPLPLLSFPTDKWSTVWYGRVINDRHGATLSNSPRRLPCLQPCSPSWSVVSWPCAQPKSVLLPEEPSLRRHCSL